jgi:hypothetical protein
MMCGGFKEAATCGPDEQLLLDTVKVEVRKFT